MMAALMRSRLGFWALMPPKRSTTLVNRDLRKLSEIAEWICPAVAGSRPGTMYRRPRAA